MDPSHNTMQDLFAQLGLPDDEASMQQFIRQHRPLPLSTHLSDAPFWSPSQAALIRQKLLDDSDWALTIDTLNVQLRQPGGGDGHADGHADGPDRNEGAGESLGEAVGEAVGLLPGRA